MKRYKNVMWHIERGTLHSIAVLSLIFILLEHFLNFEITPILWNWAMQSCVINDILLEIPIVFFIFCCMFSPTSWKKFCLFNVLHHKCQSKEKGICLSKIKTTFWIVVLAYKKVKADLEITNTLNTKSQVSEAKTR